MIRDEAKWNSRVGAYELPCLQCGTSFFAKRSDAKFCGAICRKASARRKEQIERAAMNAIGQIAYIRSMASKYPDLEIVAGLQLDRLAKELNVSRRQNTDTRVSVTLASETDNQTCPKCGREGVYVSQFTNMCEVCIREDMKKTG